MAQFTIVQKSETYYTIEADSEIEALATYALMESAGTLEDGMTFDDEAILLTSDSREIVLD